MKYLTTIDSTKYTNRIRIFYNESNDTFVIKIKESNKRMVFDFRNLEFIEMDDNYNLYEIALINAYFVYNADEFNRVLNEGPNEYDFTGDKFKMPNVDMENSRCIYDLNDLTIKLLG